MELWCGPEVGEGDRGRDFPWGVSPIFVLVFVWTIYVDNLFCNSRLLTNVADNISNVGELKWFGAQ